MTDTSIEKLQADLAKALESIEKLQTKNSELISREKTAKQAADDAKTAAEEAAQSAAEKAGDVDSVKASYEARLKKLTDDHSSAVKGLNGQLTTLLIDNGIKAELAAHNVPAHFHKAVTAMMKADATIKDGAALIGDLPLADAFASFVTSDEGKHYVSAPQNSGGGAVGSTTRASGHDFTKENFNARTGEWMGLADSNPAEAKRIALEVGRPDLARDL
jgi:FtsZ-binding cell division protein ZapB